MTIDLLYVNLDGCFAPGQAYVACSRGRSAETMCVDNFSEERIITSDLVKEFYASLKNGTEFTAPTWTVALEDAKTEEDIKQILMKRYESKRCKRCQSVCKVYKVKKEGKNEGKWVAQCKENLDSFCETGVSEHGHTFDYLPAPDLA